MTKKEYAARKELASQISAFIKQETHGTGKGHSKGKTLELLKQLCERFSAEPPSFEPETAVHSCFDTLEEMLDTSYIRIRNYETLELFGCRHVMKYLKQVKRAYADKKHCLPFVPYTLTVQFGDKIYHVVSAGVLQEQAYASLISLVEFYNLHAKEKDWEKLSFGHCNKISVTGKNHDMYTVILKFTKFPGSTVHFTELNNL